MTPFRLTLSAVALAAAQAVSAQAPESSAAKTSAWDAVGAAERTSPAAGSASAPAPEASPALSEPRIIRGNDRVIAAPKAVPPIEGAAASFNFEEAPVADVVRAILGDVLKTDYVLHPPLAGSVTLATRAPVPPDQAVFLLETALQANGLAMVRDARGSYHIGRPDMLRSIAGTVRQVGAGPLPAGSGVVIVPLQYIGAGEMASILRPLMPADALLRVDTVRNLLVLVGNRAQAEGWMELVSTFDVDLLKGMSVGVFPLRYVSAKEVEVALQLMNSAGGAAAAPAAAAPAQPGAARPGNAPAAATPAAAVELGPLAGAVRIVPIERINSVLVVTPRAAYLDEARRWIEKLDRPSENGSEPQLYVYPVRNGSARHLADVLSGLFGDGRTAQSSTGSGVAPGLSSTTGTTGGFGNYALGSPGVAGTGLGGSAYRSTGSGMGGSMGTAAPFGAAVQSQPAQNAPRVTSSAIGGLRVIADEVNNAILVYGTRGDYNKIEAALRRLDIPPAQVLIEVSIVEVSLGDDLKYGLQWSFSDKTRHGLSGIGRVGKQAVTNPLAGFAYTLTDAASAVRATLNALAEKSRVRMLSNPSLMVLDNHVATINVGDQQPIKTGDTTYLNTASAAGAAVSTTYQYKDTGVQLSVQPSVNAGDVVTMQINQAVTDLGKFDNSTNQYAFVQRQIASKVAVRSGETLVLGGLIKDNTSTSRAGVPFLHDLPVVGHAFGSTTTDEKRTELLVILTPRVVRSDQDVRQVSAEMRDRMQTLNREHTGAPAVRPQGPDRPLQPLPPQ